jgi:hypothetical protein
MIRKSGTALICLLYIIFSVTIASDFFRWNESRREAREFALAKGFSPTEVCAGYEYDGLYNTNPSDCRYVVSFSELPQLKVEEKFPYSSIWGSRQRNLYLLKKD